MKAISALAALLILAPFSAQASDSCIWMSDPNSIYQLNTPSNSVTKSTAASVQALAMESKGCGVWGWTSGGINQYGEQGELIKSIGFDQLIQRYASDLVAKQALALLKATSSTKSLSYSPKDGTFWLAGGSGLVHLDKQGNLLNSALLPSDALDLAIDLDQSVWVLSKNELSHYSKSGKLLTQVTLQGRYDSIKQIALDKIGDQIWLAGANTLWQLDLNNLNQTTPVIPPAAWTEGVTYQVGQSVSYEGYTYKALTAHTAFVGAGWNPPATSSLWQRTGTVNPPADPEAWLLGLAYQVGQFVNFKGKRYQALSAHTAYIGADWTPETSPTLWKLIGDAVITNPNPATGLQISLSGTLQTAAINSKTGEVWVVTTNKLQSYGWRGDLKKSQDLAVLGVKDPKQLRFDAASQSFWLQSLGLVTQFNAQGDKLVQISVSNENGQLGATAFNLAPIASVQSPVGVLNNATPSFAFTYGAQCNEQPCGFDADYFSNYKITATLDGQIITNLFTNNSAQQASYTPSTALSNGAHKVTIQAVDQFGYTSPVAEQTFFIDTIPPKFLNVLPATGSAVSATQLNLTGSVDDPEALVTFNNAAAFGVSSNNPAKGSFAWELNLKPGLNTIELTAVDQAGNSTTFTASYTYNAAPPAAPIVAKISVSKVQNNSVSITAAAGAVGSGLKVTIINPRTNQSQQITATDSGSFSASITAQAGDALTLFATDNSGTKSKEVTLAVAADNIPPVDPNVIPADPLTQASKIDPTVPTRLASSTEFLYTGANPIQTGVAPGTIEVRRAAVVRGRVTDRDGKPLPGVKVSILNHPEFGQTISRANGLFDMAVNGGGYLTVNYNKDGVLPAQRTINVPWQEYVVAPNVALVTLDSQATSIQFGAAETQIARGSSVTDQDGTRQATLIFPQGTTATMKLADGTVQTLTSATVRATEYTVGTNGRNAMPGDLPPTSGYTYAVELSLDEAIAAGATTVEFNQPVYNYVENFLNFPTGGIVPTGYYDRQKAAWKASENGRIVKILNVNGGVATLDVDGNGLPADAARLAQFNISDAERVKLAQIYNAGISLWRVPIKHLTPWDHNWPYGPPSDAIEPDFALTAILLPDDNSKEECGSIIECENQSLGESIAITGTSLRLNYKSSRTPAAQTMGFTINLTGAVVPSSLHHIELEVRVAGRYFKQSFNPLPNAKYRFDWDGLDAYGRPVQGAQKAQIGLGYVYQAEYKTPAEFPQSFGAFGGSTLTKDSGRNEVTIWKNQIVLLGGLTSRMHGLGDWFVDAVNAYDPSANTLYFGDGSNQSGTSINSWQTTAIADIAKPSYWTDRIAINSSGDVLFVDQYSSLLNKVDEAGKITTIAGTGPKNIIQNGDRLSELGSSVGFAHIHIDGKNNLYFVSNNSIFRAGPDGIVNKIAGNGSYKAPIDSVQALASSMEPMKIQTNQAGEVLFLDTSGLLCKINSDGILNVIAGGDQKGYSGDGGALSNAGVGNIRSFTLDPKDNIYIADAYRRVRKVTQDGVIKTIAGNGGKSTLPSDWGKPALAAGFWEMQDLSVDSFGNVFIADGSGYNVIKISQDGFLTKVPFGQHALWRLTLGRNGEIYAVDANDKKLYKMASIYPAFGVGDLIIPSRNGQEIYQFDGSGRQVKSLRSDGKTILYQFEYTTNGYISKITDNYQNVVQIERDASEKASAIIAPNGQRTELVLDSNGHLASITNPASETHRMTYSNDGLLKTFTTPRNKTSTMTYQDGLLVKDQNAIGGGWTLARTQLGERNFEVSMTSGLNRSTRYRTEYSATGDMIKSTIGPDSTTSVSTQKPDGTSQATNADGTISTTATGPDPRFGMQAPIQTNLSVKLPSGLTMQQTQTRSVVLANKADPLSLQSETNTSTINGKTFTSVFDAIQKRVSITSAANRITVTQLDAQGRPLSVQQTGILPLNYQYDARGRVEKVTQGAGDAERGVRYTYNAAGEADTITDAVGRITKYGYDLAGRVKTITQPDGRVVAFSYDANGNVTSVTPPTRPAHGFTFNDIDLASTYLPPELQAGQALNTQYEYNLDQQPTKVTRPDGKAIEYGYDEFGRLAALKSADGQIGYAYRAVTGQLASVTAGNVSHSYTYDGALPKTIAVTGPAPGNIGITYDNFFRVQQLGINGQNTSYGYDNDGLLTQAGALTLNRNASNGLLTGTTLNNIQTEQEYDEFGQLKRLTAKQGNAALFSETFTRDKLGRIEEKTSTTGGPVSTYHYAYDAAGRLSDVFKNGVLQNHYEYDANGNRTLADGIAATYDAQDRLKTFGTTSYGFSANGELQSESTAAGNNTFSYDVYGNLKQVTLATGGQIDYLVDGQNRRIGKKVNGVLTQGWVYQDQLKPIAELDGNGQIVSRFVYAGKANVPEYVVKGGTTYRLVTDTLGSVRQVVDSQTGQVVQELDYDAWGKVTQDSNPGFQPFGYAGGLYDNNTGLVRFGARDYDAKTARWTAKDPIGFNGGDSNIYAYVNNNPIAYSDPTGFETLHCARELGGRDGTPMTPSGNPLRHDYLVVDGKVKSFQAGDNMLWSQGRIDSNENPSNDKCVSISKDKLFDKKVERAIETIGAPKYSIGAYPLTSPYVLGARNCQSWVAEVLNNASKQ